MVIETEELTLMFRGLSDGSDGDPSDEPQEISGGIGDDSEKKHKPGAGDDDALPEEDADATGIEEDKEDDLTDDGTGDM
jgi:hypothetical protein